MEKEVIKTLVQKYFDGESSLQEEEQLVTYFSSPGVEDDLNEHKILFTGIKELSEHQLAAPIEDQILDLINKKEHEEKDNRRWIWNTVKGVAATLLILLAGFLIFRTQSPLEDSFDDPDEAYAYAEQTLGYMASKYQKGVYPLTNLDKIQDVSSTFNKNISKISNGFSQINRLNKYKIKEN